MKGINKIFKFTEGFKTSHMHNKEQVSFSYHIKIKTIPTKTNHNQPK